MYGTARPEVTVTPLAADKLDLSGKRVHVIGGTSGIGRALALSCAAKGAAVTVVGRSFKARAPHEACGRLAHLWHCASVMSAVRTRCRSLRRFARVARPAADCHSPRTAMRCVSASYPSVRAQRALVG